MYTAALSATTRDRFQRWFFEGSLGETVGPHAKPAHTASWWRVMCLTGVDYFSTLAYQPSIAFVAAGVLSPIATLVLVLLTVFGALPMYYRVAEASPHGQGSILMLEALFPRWKGKAVVLILLGFAATSFVITITLSAADATAHLIENPLVPHWLHHPLLVTLALLFVLGAVFMRGFSEVIGMAVIIVAIYLVLNAVVVVTGLRLIWAHPELLQGLARGAADAARKPADDDHGRAARVPEARARPVGVRDRRRGDAAREGRSGRHRGTAAGPDPQHEEAAARRRA